ncbi:pilus assembly PilX family protein [Billgrantia gudaonensis]|nr:PilX N-terminal domain-containing pilus assembly protein [Halomonas gudaonensis]
MKQQQGAALVVVLSMLTMSLMLGLSGMQSSLVEERLAGNYKAATEAQMAAEKAVSAAFDKEDLSSDDFEVGGLDDFESVAWDGFGEGLTVDENVCEGSVGCKYVYVEAEGEYYIVSLGSVLSNGGEVLATSDPLFVKVDLDEGYAGPSAVNFPGGLSDDANVHWPNSNKSRIAGQGESGDSFYVSALSVFEGEGLYSRDDILSEVERGNNKTGLRDGTLESYSKSGKEMLVENIKKLYDEYLADDKRSGVVFHEGGMTLSGNSSVEGLHIVLGGEVNFNGNVDLGGSLIVLDVENLDDYKDGSDVGWKVGAVTEARFNGGGNKGSVWYQEEVVVDALEPYGFSLEEFFGGGDSGKVGGKPKISEWR